MPRNRSMTDGGRPWSHSQMLGEELVMPDQFQMRGSNGRASGERALLIAVIECAMRDVRRGLTSPETVAMAQRWFAGANSALPFVYCCQFLGLDPDAVRAALPTALIRPRHGYQRDVVSVSQYREATRHRRSDHLLARRRRTGQAPCATGGPPCGPDPATESE